MVPSKKTTLQIRENTIAAPFARIPDEATLQSNQQGKILQADSRLSAFTGYSPAEIKNLLLFNLIPDLTGNLLRQWRDTLERQGHFEQQINLLQADEELIPVYLMGYAVEGSDNFYIQIYKGEIGILQNQDEINLLRLGAKRAKIAHWRWNLATDVCLLCESFFEILQLKEQASLTLSGKRFFALLRPYFDSKEFSLLKQSFECLEKGKEIQQSLTNVVDGRSFEWWAQPIIRDQKITEIHGIIRDVILTEQELIYNKLAKKQIDESSALHIWIDKNGKVIFINEAACEYLGYKQGECMEGVSLLNIDVEHTERHWKEIQEKAQGGGDINVISSFQRKNGTVFPVEIFLQKLADDIFSLQAKDITHLRQEEAQLQSTLLGINSLSQQLAAENTYLQEEAAIEFEDIICRSEPYQKVLKQISQVAPTHATVLIEGETGTGKELLARAIHRLSSRKHRAIVKVNCAALPANLIESELFGHERGAFTGADKQRIGRFEVADEGTLFLDEIGELPLDVQVKLLRVLQEGEFERLGGNQTHQVNVRIIAATNRELVKMVKEGTFREDLYYRLNVFPIYNIPLRERREDIPLLAAYFTEKFTKRMNKSCLQIRKADMHKLEQYSYPGNIRELENIIERAAILSPGNFLELSSWKPVDVQNKQQDSEDFKSLEEVQIEQILKALEKTSWRVSGASGAANLLEINPQTLFSRMKKYGINRDDD